MDLHLCLDLLEEDLPAAERLARSLGLELQRGTGPRRHDIYIPWAAPDGEKYLIRLRCDGYDEQAPSFQFVNPANPEETGPQWWARMNGMGYPRGDGAEVVYCTPGIREYHNHPSHRHESHPKSAWRLPTVIFLVWKYVSGQYGGKGGV